MQIIRVADAATIFSRSIAPPPPLIARNAESISSAPSMTRSLSRDIGEVEHRDPRRPRGRLGGERRADRGDAQPFLPDAAPERGNGEGRRAARAETDEHPALDLGDGSLGGLSVCQLAIEGGARS